MAKLALFVLVLAVIAIGLGLAGPEAGQGYSGLWMGMLSVAVLLGLGLLLRALVGRRR